MIHGVLVTSPLKHSMEITEYFVVGSFLFLCLGFWLGEGGVVCLVFCFLGLFFRSFFPGSLIILQWTFASSHETREPEFLISEEELGVVVRSTFYLLLLKLSYASKNAEIIIQSLMFLSIQIVANYFQKWVLETVQGASESLYIIWFSSVHTSIWQKNHSDTLLSQHRVKKEYQLIMLWAKTSGRFFSGAQVSICIYSCRERFRTEMSLCRSWSYWGRIQCHRIYSSMQGEKVLSKLKNIWLW